MKDYKTNKKFFAKEIIIFFSFLAILITIFFSLLIYKAINDNRRSKLWQEGQELQHSINELHYKLDAKLEARTKMYNTLINNEKLRHFTFYYPYANSTQPDESTFSFNKILDENLVDSLWNEAFYERVENKHEIDYTTFFKTAKTQTISHSYVVRDNYISDDFDFHSKGELQDFFVTNYVTKEDSLAQVKLNELNIEHLEITSTYLQVKNRQIEDFKGLMQILGFAFLILFIIFYVIRYSFYAIKWALKNI